MPTISRSAAKRLRQSEKRTIVNNKAKGNIDFLIKKAYKAITAKDNNQITETVKKAVKAIDKAVQKKIIKKNTAARKKKQLFFALKKK